MLQSVVRGYRSMLRLRVHGTPVLLYVFHVHANAAMRADRRREFFIGASILFLYLFVFWFNTATDAAEDSVNHDGYALHRLRLMRRASLVCAALAIGGFVVFPEYFASDLLWIHLVTLFLGYWYSAPVPALNLNRRLKDIPFGKNSSAAIIWMLPAVVLPTLAFENRLPTAFDAAFYFAVFFFFEFLGDIVDWAGDARAGVRTVPVVIGRKRALGMLAALWIAFGFLFRCWSIAPRAWVWALMGLMGLGYSLGESVLQSVFLVVGIALWAPLLAR